MLPAPKHSRRWFQFGLGTMLLLVALVAVSAFAAREHHERKQLEAQLTESEMRAQRLQTAYENNATEMVSLLQLLQELQAKAGEQRTSVPNSPAAPTK
jgi:hypothetical protein